jgi:hypothetical protein
MVGDLKGYGTVWYHSEGIANILSLSRVRRNFRVTYDSKDGNVFRLKPDESVREFRESASGLYFSDSADNGIMMVNTVAENRSSYTNADYSRAALARKLQVIIGRLSTKDFIRVVEGNHLPNCPINRHDIMAAEHIFGPDVGSLKGKTVRRAPIGARPLLTTIPAEVMSRYRSVTLCADIMFVNKIPFFVTISRGIKFGTAEMITSRHHKAILGAIKQVCRIYRTRGFRVELLLMDGEFESLRGDMAELGITLNTTAKDEHVGEIERYIRTIKERTRCIYNTLPFTRMPARLLIEMVYTSVFWLNSFPAQDGVSDTLSPCTLVTGQTLDYNKHCRLEFATYAQTHEDHDN